MQPRPRLKLSYAAALLLLPLIALWHQDDALFSPLWQSDPWFYLGYFRNLANFKDHLFPDFYYGSRLSWIIPGFLLHRFLPPLYANAILHLAAHTLATVSLFWILRSSAGIRAAFLTSIFFSANPWFWTATGWDHVTGGVIAFFLFSMACLTEAADSPSRKWALYLAGAGAACAIFAHLFIAPFVGLAILYYVFLLWVRRYPLRATLAVAAARLTTGFLMVTVPLSLINCFLLDGSFWFWAPSFRTASAVINNYIWGASLWWPHNRLAPWLWLLMASVALAVFWVCRWRDARDVRNSVRWIVSVQLILAAAFMTAMEMRGITLLAHYYYACYLFPFAFLVIGHSFWPSVQKMKDLTYVLVCLAAILLMAAAWYDPFQHPAPGEPLLLGIAGGSLAASLALRRWQAAAFLAVAGFSVLLYSTYDGTNSSGRLHARRDEYLRVINARERIEQRRDEYPIIFWYDRNEPAYQEFCALNASYMAEFARISEHFPEGCPTRTALGTLFVVPSLRSDAEEVSQKTLTGCWSGLRLKPVFEETFVESKGPRPYAVSLLNAEPDRTGLQALAATFNNASGKGTLALAASPSQEMPLPLDRWKPVAGASESITPTGMEAETPSYRYAYAFAYPPLEVPSAGQYRFVLRYSIRSGQFAFGAFPADESHWLTSVQSLHRSAKHDEVAFSLQLQQGDSVILRVANNNYDDHSSLLTLESATVWLVAPLK